MNMNELSIARSLDTLDNRLEALDRRLDALEADVQKLRERVLRAGDPNTLADEVYRWAMRFSDE